MFETATLTGLDSKLETALVAAGGAIIGALLGTLLKFIFDRKLQRHALKVSHEYEQRRALKELTDRYRGRLVEAADLFSFRMRQYVYNGNAPPLSHASEDPERAYYFQSTVLRFLVLTSTVSRFERDAFFIDEQFGDRDDLTLLWLSKGIRWMATDVSLFDGIDAYSRSSAHDHFYTDQLRDMCSLIVKGDETELLLSEFEELMDRDMGRGKPILVVRHGEGTATSGHWPRLARADGQQRLKPAIDFFDGIDSHEGRYRWDRLVAFHLLAMGLLRVFGYKPQKPKPDHFDDVAQRIENTQTADNLLRLLDQLRVSERVPALSRAVEKQCSPQALANRASARARRPIWDRARARARGLVRG